jgi:hypothetical protein
VCDGDENTAPVCDERRQTPHRCATNDDKHATATKTRRTTRIHSTAWGWNSTPLHRRSTATKTPHRCATNDANSFDGAVMAFDGTHENATNNVKNNPGAVLNGDENATANPRRRRKHGERRHA